jgi:hypothetical protein
VTLKESASMARPEFEIIIGKTGKVTVEIKGVKGPRCIEYADLLKEIVGREEGRHLTADYYAPDTEVRIDSKVRKSTGA